MATRTTREKDAGKTHPLWQLLGAIDGWITGKMLDLWRWVSTRSTAVVKLIWIPFCLIIGPLGALLSPVLMILAGLVCLLSLLIVLSRFVRGLPLKSWAAVAAFAFALAVGPFHEMSVILYSPQENDLLGLNPDVQEYCREAEAAGTADEESMCDPPWKKLPGPFSNVIDDVRG